VISSSLANISPLTMSLKAARGHAKPSQRALDRQGHIDDDFLLFGVLLAAHRDQVSTTHPANPTCDIQEEQARNQEFPSVGQIAIDHQVGQTIGRTAG
jgi:hypothetical protein